jgi:hypothetical protein
VSVANFRLQRSQRTLADIRVRLVGVQESSPELAEAIGDALNHVVKAEHLAARLLRESVGVKT